MKLTQIKIIIFFVVLFISCSDRSLFTDPNDPGLGGYYTILKGELSGVLLRSKSPYYATSTISVTAGNRLVIEPGTIIFFKAGTGLIISGGIRAIGSKDSPILFKGVRDEWSGIHSINPTDSLIFVFCRIQDVYLPISSWYKNGAIDAANAKIKVRNCYFYYNYAQNGGALSLSYCNSEIVNNVFYRNQSLDYGGAIFSTNSFNRIINNTFYRNYCINFGGAITLTNPVYEEIQNNIFYDNFSYRGDARIHFVSGDSSNIFEQYNFLAPDSLNPLFISSTDFHLQENSPCKDAGNPAQEFNDWDGSRNDQGAYGGPNGNW